MPNVVLYNMEGGTVGNIELSDAVFGCEINESAMHEVVKNYLANQRQGTQSTKTRTEVRGGGKKPWRQKGTGRARQGSIRAPQWIGGGVALGPKPRSYRYTLNKKLRRLAMKSALSSKAANNEIYVLDSLTLSEIKTKEMKKVLDGLGVQNALIVTETADKNIYLSARNIEGSVATIVGSLNVYDILKHHCFVTTQAAVEKIQEVYC